LILLNKLNNRRRGLAFAATMVVVLLICSGTSHAEIKKVWESELTQILDIKPSMGKGKQTQFSTGENALSSTYFPILVSDQLLLATNKGHISAVDVNSQEVIPITQIPVDIQSALVFSNRYPIFVGNHLTNRSHYYCAVSLSEKKTLGVFRHNKPLIPFGSWAVLERNKTFIVYNPQNGRKVYSQKTDYELDRQIYTSNDKRYVFQTKAKHLVDIKLPKFGASIMISHRNKRTDVLEFDSLAQIEPDMVADNIDRNTLFYHRKNGFIGQLKLNTKRVIWERSYFSKDMSIKGPLAYRSLLFYLVSYPKQKDKANQGKIIALDRKTGQAVWLSKDLPFHNFDIVRFNDYILSVDDDGYLLFLDYKTGAVKNRFKVGEGLSRPLVKDNSLYVLTSEKLYRFKDTSVIFWLKLKWTWLTEEYF